VLLDALFLEPTRGVFQILLAMGLMVAYMILMKKIMGNEV